MKNHKTCFVGKTTLSIQIAKHFEAALLTIDGVVLEAISNGNTPAGLKARELCSEAAHRVAEELKAAEAEGGDVVGDVKKGPAAAGGLSVEAVTAHTQGTGGHEGKPLHAPSTVISNRKTSTISDPKSKAAKQASDAGKTGAISSGEGGSQVRLCGCMELGGWRVLQFGGGFWRTLSVFCVASFLKLNIVLIIFG